MGARVLFLDDSEERIERFRSDNPTSVVVKTAENAIFNLSQGCWDLVYLDHDLGGETFVDSNRPDCGMEVVRWVAKNKPSVGRFVVHSYNIPRAKEMYYGLMEAGYAVIQIPFGRKDSK